MNKSRGAAFILTLILSSVLAVLLGSFFFKGIADNELAQRYAHSTRALWLAEAGAAQVMGSGGLTSVSGTIDNPNYAYSAVVTPISGNYYRIDSTGSVTLPTGEIITRMIERTVRTGSVDPTKFPYGIETTTNLVMKGHVQIHPSSSWHEFAVLDFADLFTVTKAEMKASASHLYDDSNFAAPVDGITWVDVTGGSDLNIAGNLVGSGILVVNGDTRISGTVFFEGIIYVIGELTITGTVVTSGAVLAESDTTVDTELKGTVDIYYDVADITAALHWVSFIHKTAVSWKEL